MSRSEGARNQYSSRGIGIPVGGAIGGGDDFAQRIGKPYVPKPFRSQGGFEGSADSTYSYKLGRHNVDDDTGHTDFNIDSLATRKIAGPRKLPRGFKLDKQPYGKLQDFEELGDKAITSAAMQFESKINDYVSSVLAEVPDDDEDEAYANEFSGVGAIAGYTGPLGAPARQKDFYKRMAKPYGGTYLVDPKKIKARP